MPNLNYTAALPNPPNFPSQDVGDMQVNCNSVQNIFGGAQSVNPTLDNIGFGQLTGGFHNQVSMPAQAAPGLQGMSGVLYCNANGPINWPWWQWGNAANQFFQITGSNSPTANPSPTTNGWSFLPGGVIIQWGTNTAVSSGSFGSGAAAGTVTFSAANIAFPANCFFVLTMPFYNGGAVPNGAAGVSIAQSGSGALSKTAFNWKFNSNSGSYTGFYWLAVGN